MPIPELQRAKAKRLLARFVDRVPEHVRDQLRYEVELKGNVFSLVEVRPAFRGDGETRLEVARFRYRPTKGGWTLQWSDRNERWHTYEGFELVEDIAALVDEVERDPTCIFFG